MIGLVVVTVIFLVLAVVIVFVATAMFNLHIGCAVAAMILGVSLVLAIAGANYMSTFRDDQWRTCYVTGKDRGGEDGSYRVYTSNCGVLGNKDSVFRLKFNSADVWQEIPDEGPIDLRTAGSRVPLLSMFPNIFDVREATGQAES